MTERPQPYPGACFIENGDEGTPVGTMEECYPGHVPIDVLKKYDLIPEHGRVIYDRGWQEEPITRVSYPAVHPHTIIEVKDGTN